MATPQSLPIIDISPFLPGTSVTVEEKKQCAHALAVACRDRGFFYLTNHGLPRRQTEEILDLCREFFTAAGEREKVAVARQDAGIGIGDGARGYQRVGENVTQGQKDWHEAVDFYRDIDPGEPPYDLLMGRNMWPEYPSMLRPKYEAYVKDLLKLGEIVVRAMAYALDPTDSEVFVNATKESFWVMRMIAYPPLPDAEADSGGVSCGTHTDYGCVTFLLADDTEGALQVKDRSGSWLKADPIAGAFVVNIGDMMERWTNGLWKSTQHRVIHRGKHGRVSVPFFFEPDFDAKIKPLATCVSRTGGAELYKEIQYGEHLLGKVRGNFNGKT